MTKRARITRLNALLISAHMTFAASVPAQAFNFGFVRVPDWMDSYIGWLFLATCIGFAGLFITKPRGVPIAELRNMRLSPIVNFFRFGTFIVFVILMAMVFVGMGLRRFAEA